MVPAEDMFREVSKRAEDADVVIKAAAVADFTPKETAGEKIKKGSEEEMTVSFRRTKDILAYLGEQKKPGQKLCGFSMETEHLLENSRKKLEKKHADMIVANQLKQEGAGFGGDTNVVTLITKDDTRPLPLMSKAEVANAVLDALNEI